MIHMNGLMEQYFVLLHKFPEVALEDLETLHREYTSKLIYVNDCLILADGRNTTLEDAHRLSLTYQEGQKSWMESGDNTIHVDSFVDAPDIFYAISLGMRFAFQVRNKIRALSGKPGKILLSFQDDEYTGCFARSCIYRANDNHDLGHLEKYSQPVMIIV